MLYVQRSSICLVFFRIKDLTPLLSLLSSLSQTTASQPAFSYNGRSQEHLRNPLHCCCRSSRCASRHGNQEGGMYLRGLHLPHAHVSLVQDVSVNINLCQAPNFQNCITVPVNTDTCVDLTGGLSFLDKSISATVIPSGFVCTFDA